MRHAATAAPTVAPTKRRPTRPQPTAAPSAAAPTATAAPAAEPTTAPTAAAKKELKYGLTLVVSGIDPHIHSSSELGIPLTSVYDTLVYLTADNKFVPGPGRVVDGLGRTAKRYTFKLRKDVKFHDGTPFNAQAVKDNLDRIVDPATKSARRIRCWDRTRAPRWWTSSRPR